LCKWCSSDTRKSGLREIEGTCISCWYKRAKDLEEELDLYAEALASAILRRKGEREIGALKTLQHQQTQSVRTFDVEEKRMKSTGIIRRIDDLGRVIIPKEVRRILDLHEDNPFEIFIVDGDVVFRKYNGEE